MEYTICKFDTDENVLSYIAANPAVTKGFWLLVDASRYGKNNVAVRVHLPYNKLLIAGLADEISQIRLTHNMHEWHKRNSDYVFEYDEDPEPTFGSIRQGACFYEGHVKIGGVGKNVIYRTQYGS